MIFRLFRRITRRRRFNRAIEELWQMKNDAPTNILIETATTGKMSLK